MSSFRRPVNSVAFIVKDDDVEIYFMAVLVAKDEIPGTRIRTGNILEATPIQECTGRLHVLLLDDDIKVIMRARLFTEQSVDTPPAVNPNLYVQAFQISIEVYYVSGSHFRHRSSLRVKPQEQGRSCYPHSLVILRFKRRIHHAILYPALPRISLTEMQAGDSDGSSHSDLLLRLYSRTAVSKAMLPKKSPPAPAKRCADSSSNS